MRQKKIRFIFGILTILFLLTLFLSGCASTELQRVKKSASTLQLKTGREIYRYTQDLDPEWMPVVSKSHPEVKIRYEPINGYTTKEVFDEIAAILKRNNWEEDESYIVPDAFWASLQQQGQYDLHTSVFIDSNKNIVSIHIESLVTR
jgi:hypothetical protein